MRINGVIPFHWVVGNAHLRRKVWFWGGKVRFPPVVLEQFIYTEKAVSIPSLTGGEDSTAGEDHKLLAGILQVQPDNLWGILPLNRCRLDL